MPVVFIPAALRPLTHGVQQVIVNGATVREIIDELDEQFPGLKDRLCVQNQLRPGLAVAIDSRVHGHGLLERVEPQSEVHFVPTVSGG